VCTPHILFPNYFHISRDLILYNNIFIYALNLEWKAKFSILFNFYKTFTFLLLFVEHQLDAEARSLVLYLPNGCGRGRGLMASKIFMSSLVLSHEILNLWALSLKTLARPLFHPGLLRPAGACRINCCYPTDHLCRLHPSPFALQRKWADSISALRNAHYLHSKYEDMSLSYGRKEDCLKFSDKG
jgi:hypothetical protein